MQSWRCRLAAIYSGRGEMEIIGLVYQWLGEGPGAAAVLVGVIALGGALSGAAMSYMIASRAQYINTITLERSKWIEKLRVNIASYSSELMRLATSLIQHRMGEDVGAESERRVFDSVNGIERVKHLIELQLNPWGEIDKNILKILDGFKYGGGLNATHSRRFNKLLIEHSRWLLKMEWEKVKYEARGPIYRLCNCRYESKWLKAYKQWVRAEGSYVAVLAEFAQLAQADATPVQHGDE